ncbi:hypothetical protein DAI22_10g064550 [Oryza sativa Japonica Group]|uniref:Uncharacterized protein n=1 Tax=Oryza rufipogon TaxID=4529 RepID=A0A0E0QXZ0_ORYRU|nr:hypothetical protein DAI22_10g064550 [Oryza sativa Japonica Group]
MAFLSSCSSFSSRQRVASQLMGALPGGTLSRPLANPSIFSASGDLASYRLSVSPIFASSSAGMLNLCIFLLCLTKWQNKTCDISQSAATLCSS